MSTTTIVDATAHAAIASACQDVRDAVEGDHVDGVPAAVVARPTSTEQVSEVLRATDAHGLTVVATGRRTKLTWGRPPTSADVLLDLSGLDQVLEHAAGDLIVVTQAGARLSDVQETVSRSRQLLAVDETVPGSSIGGTLAAATSGPGRVAAGTMRDLLIGLTVVRADGVIAKSGGRVVKNVAGYDVGKLVAGSFGTLAVITEALFRLHPLPATRRWVTLPFDDAAEAHRLTQSVLHAQCVAGAVEVDWPADNPGTLGILLAGNDDGVAGRTSTVLSLLGSDAHEDDVAPAGWSTYPWDPAATGDDRSIALKLTFALSGLPDILAAARNTGTPVALRGSAGAGVVYAAIPSGTDLAEVSATVDALRPVCMRHGGSLVVLDAPAAIKQAVDTWGPIPAIDLMRRVKDQFDPDHRLAPGRFVGGI